MIGLCVVLQWRGQVPDLGSALWLLFLFLLDLLLFLDYFLFLSLFLTLSTLVSHRMPPFHLHSSLDRSGLRCRSNDAHIMHPEAVLVKPTSRRMEECRRLANALRLGPSGPGCALIIRAWVSDEKSIPCLTFGLLQCRMVFDCCGRAWI